MRKTRNHTNAEKEVKKDLILNENENEK